MNEFNRIFERDIDLLVIEEFKCNKLFREIFFNKIKEKNDFVKCTAFHSSYTRFGETDITFILERSNGEKFGLLIENKITAPTMKNQSYRYSVRAEGLKKDGIFNNYSTFLIAPRDYVVSHRNDKNAVFDNIVYYEEIIAFFESMGDIRSIHKSMMFQYAISKKEADCPLYNEKVSDFWIKFSEYCSKTHPELSMIEASNIHGENSNWISFRCYLQKSKIIYKADRGFIDLQIQNFEFIKDKINSIHNNSLFNRYTICETGKSTSIRLDSERYIIDFHNDFSDSKFVISEILTEVSNLLSLSKTLS